MVAIRLLFGQTQVCFTLFSSFAFATLQNVTVDDAATTGAATPTYLPSPSNWNIGNSCEACVVKPNASLAYDGTWHDMLFYPSSNISQAFEFTFVGSGLYIYFILANSVPTSLASWLTNVSFTLDGVQVATFLHNSSTSTNFEYNQAVFANGSIPYGQHTMVVAPINDTVNNVLILFDYFIYTTDTSAVPVSSDSAITTYIPLPSSSSSMSIEPPASSSELDIGAIIGGVVAGVGALVAVGVFLLCYWRPKTRIGERSFRAPLDPFVLSRQVPPTFSEGTQSIPIQQMESSFPPTESERIRKPTATAPVMTLQPPNPASSSAQSSGPGASSGSTAEILEQLGNLRDELASFRRLQDQSLHHDIVGPEPPPQYF